MLSASMYFPVRRRASARAACAATLDESAIKDSFKSSMPLPSSPSRNQASALLNNVVASSCSSHGASFFLSMASVELKPSMASLYCFSWKATTARFAQHR